MAAGGATDLVSVEVDDAGIALLTLNSPDTRNAVSLQLSEQIERAVAELAEDETARVLIVTGAGSAFCAGADRSVLARADRELLSAVYRAFLVVRDAPIPTIAAVNGPAVGAGLNLALACDVRIAAESAVFDTRFLRLGVHGGGGVSWMLQRAAGASAATAMLLFGEPVDGARAAQLGLAWDCVPDDQLISRSRELAQAAASAAPELVRLTKDTLAVAQAVTEHADVLDVELRRQVWTFTAADQRGPWRDLLDPTSGA